MNLKETKFYFENIFSTLWADTPVHYAGMDFDATKQQKWINPVYKPLRSVPNGVSVDTSIEIGQLYIVCWANSDVEAMDLADTIIDFVDDKVDKTLFRARGHYIIDHGWDDSDKVFIVISFTFEQFSGTC